MAAENIEKFLKSFGDKVLIDSLGILDRRKGSTELANSLRVTVSEEEKGIYSVKFYMLDYGTFVDEGVSGNKKERKFTNWKQEKIVSSYKYKKKQPPPDILSRWIKKKGIKPKGLGRGRDKNTGQYISNLAFLIGRKIKSQGIQGISFFQQPFGIRYEEMKEQFLKEFKKDISTYLTTFTKHK